MAGNRIRSKSFCRKITGGKGVVVMSKQTQDMPGLKNLLSEHEKELFEKPFITATTEYKSISEMNTSDAKGSMIEFVLNKKLTLREEDGHQERVQKYTDDFVK